MLFFAAEISREGDMAGIVGYAGPLDPFFSVGELLEGAAFGWKGGQLERCRLVGQYYRDCSVPGKIEQFDGRYLDDLVDKLKLGLEKNRNCQGRLLVAAVLLICI